MALIECKFFSDALNLSTSMTVILPEDTQGQIGMDNIKSSNNTPVLYLLHGMSDDHSIWLRRTSIERYVANLGIAVVMPEVHRSYYANMRMGLDFWTFISDELPKKVASMFNVSTAPEDTFVAGLSMGGYGALKLGLNFPEKFAAAASLSGALSPESLKKKFTQQDPIRFKEFQWMFGPDIDLEDCEDIHLKLKELSKHPAKIKLYQCCGTADFLYDDNLEFKKLADSLPNLDYTYEEDPEDAHEWGYWDKKIQNVLNWLPLKK